MGLILDSSVVIAAERRGDTVQAFLQRVIDTVGDQEAALSAVGVVELVHGIYRGDSAERRTRREAFVDEAPGFIRPVRARLGRIAPGRSFTAPQIVGFALSATRSSA